MKKSAIRHPQGTAEFVVQHGRRQISRGRNPSEPFDGIRNPREAFIVASLIVSGRCGCGGPIENFVGCLSYYGSEDHLLDTAQEEFMRHAGNGFGFSFDPEDAMMSMHLQAHGMTHETSVVVLTAALE